MKPNANAGMIPYLLRLVSALNQRSSKRRKRMKNVHMPLDLLLVDKALI